MTEDFTVWLQKNMDDRSWSQSELARRGGFTPTAINKILSRERMPGVEFCKGVARAFNLPEVEVLQRAGLIAIKPRGKSTKKQQIIEQMEQLDDEKIEALARYVQALTSETILESIREPQTKPAKA